MAADDAKRLDRLQTFRAELRHQRESLARYRDREVTELDARWVLNALGNVREEFPDLGSLMASLDTRGRPARRRYPPDILLRDVTIALSRIHAEMPAPD